MKQHLENCRGRKTTKIHTLVDGLGNPLAFLINGGQTHEAVATIPWLEQFEIEGSNVLGDTAYRSEQICDWISIHGGSYTIPPKANVQNPWKIDCFLYKQRNLVECFFSKIKHINRVST